MWEEVWRKPATSFQDSFPGGVTQNMLTSSSNGLWLHTWGVINQGSSRDSVPRDFTWEWSHRYPLPSVYQNPRVPEEKQVFGINHVVSINGLGAVSCCIQVGQRQWTGGCEWNHGESIDVSAPSLHLHCRDLDSHTHDLTSELLQ